MVEPDLRVQKNSSIATAFRRTHGSRTAVTLAEKCINIPPLTNVIELEPHFRRLSCREFALRRFSRWAFFIRVGARGKARTRQGGRVEDVSRYVTSHDCASPLADSGSKISSPKRTIVIDGTSCGVCHKPGVEWTNGKINGLVFCFADSLLCEVISHFAPLSHKPRFNHQRYCG
jgi:hypothetical protein